VRLVSLYWADLPSESPSKAEFAEPAAVEAQYVWVAAAVAVGIAAIASSAVLAGLAAIAAGLIWGARTHQQVESSEKARAEWASQRVCLACKRRFVP
jgi:hypothetical protein